MDNIIERIANLSAIKRELFVKEMKKYGLSEPVAIVGIGCRFPGNANNPSDFWKLLKNSVDAIVEIPKERWDIEEFFDPDQTTPGKMNTRWGGFLSNVDEFDASFFDISPREAIAIDPQQRLLMETTWEAFEDAGIVIDKLKASPTGVFIGIGSYDYGLMQLTNPNFSDAYAGMGSALSIAANRLSYLFDFRGPSISVDTACSSSLVATHLACQSLWRNEINLAVVGGVNVILTPSLTINFTKAGFMAPDGRCKAFDSRANGYVRSEGAGVIILKPFSKALNDFDKIYAVIRGSAVNQDGRSNGLTAPNRLAQEDVLRSAYRVAGISPKDVKYIETHGTGTPLGDPIEVQALASVLSVDRDPKNYCSIGSVKTNIGHLETAAGVAGLIKVALSLKNQQIPPSLHFQKPNPLIAFDSIALKVQTELAKWPEGIAIAGVSSFGFGGTNAHIVLEVAPKEKQSDLAKLSTYILPLSAQNQYSLQKLAKAYIELLTKESFETSLGDICYTASLRRSHHKHRLAIIFNTKDELIEKLNNYINGLTNKDAYTSAKNNSNGLVFAFSGQGTQWAKMGTQLIKQYPVFRSFIEDCDLILRKYGDWSLLRELLAEEPNSRLNHTEIAQPAIFAIQCGLFKLFESWGVSPSATLGHSVGEIAVAYVSGCLELEEALKIAFYRGKIMQSATAQGKMVALNLSFEETKTYIEDYKDKVSLAACNSPKQTVISGNSEALLELIEKLKLKGIHAQLLAVDYAFHSYQMLPLEEKLVAAIGRVNLKDSNISIYSTLTGQKFQLPNFDADYWGKHLVSPVLFQQALENLILEGKNTFVDIGPHPALTSSIVEIAHQNNHPFQAFGSLRRLQDELKSVFTTLAMFYTNGYKINWEGVYLEPRLPADLPLYPWQHQKLWLEKKPLQISALQTSVNNVSKDKHPLLANSQSLAYPNNTKFWQSSLTSNLDYLKEHLVQNNIIVPGVFYIDLALSALKEISNALPISITDISLHKFIFLSSKMDYVIQTICNTQKGKSQIYIYGHKDSPNINTWTLHASAIALVEEKHQSGFQNLSLEQIKTQCLELIDSKDFYKTVNTLGLTLGAPYQGIQRIWRNKQEALSEIIIKSEISPEINRYQIHPALLETVLDTLAIVFFPENFLQALDKMSLFVPMSIDKVIFYNKVNGKLWAYAKAKEEWVKKGSLLGDVCLVNENGEIIVEFLGVHFYQLEQNFNFQDKENIYYQTLWQEQVSTKLTTKSNPSNYWMIFTDGQGISESLKNILQKNGLDPILVSPAKDYVKHQKNRFSISYNEQTHIQQLFESLSLQENAILTIIYLSAIDIIEPINLEDLEQSQSLSSIGVLHLLQQIDKLPWQHLPKIFLITQLAQQILPTDKVIFPQANLWGLGRSAMQEFQALDIHLIDLKLDNKEQLKEDLAATLWKEVSNPSEENQLAFREQKLYVIRLLPTEILLNNKKHLHSDASYLITGGLGSLGLLVARWLAESSVKSIILLSRTPLPSRESWHNQTDPKLISKLAIIKEIESLGTSLHIANIDIANEIEVRKFIYDFQQANNLPIRGVFHCAGLLTDKMLIKLTGRDFEQVFRPKVMGAWILHKLFEREELDFFVIFSSIVSMLGSAGQANYAAANACLDALSQYRQSQKLPALSIAWGPWSEVGMAVESKQVQRFYKQGIRAISPKEGLDTLEKLMQQDLSPIAALDINWQTWRENYPNLYKMPIFSLLDLANNGETTYVTDTKPSAGIKENLVQAPSLERIRILENYLVQQIAATLRLAESDVATDIAVNKLGIDSLLAVELVNEIRKVLGADISMTTLLQGPTIKQLTERILLSLDLSISKDPPNLTKPDLPKETDLVEEGLLDKNYLLLKYYLANPQDLLANIDNFSQQQLNFLINAMLEESKL